MWGHFGSLGADGTASAASVHLASELALQCLGLVLVRLLGLPCTYAFDQPLGGRDPITHFFALQQLTTLGRTDVWNHSHFCLAWLRDARDARSRNELGCIGWNGVGIEGL